jgi:DNA-binding MarR family transcriptional regulator
LDDYDLQASLPYLLNRVAHRLAEAFTEDLRPFDLSIGMWRVLAVLRPGGVIRMGELAEATSIEISTLSRQITAMQARGLLRRKRSQEDARAVEVDLLPEGRMLADKILPFARRLETVTVRDMLPAEQTHLRALLEQLFVNCEALVLPELEPN